MRPLRGADLTAHRRFRRRAPETADHIVRECLPLDDPTDCLLDAYDCVAMRAYENYLANGTRPGGELEDWLNAERELLRGCKVDLHETDEFIYALSCVPGATASRTSVGIESRWIVILVREPKHSVHADSAARDTATVVTASASPDAPALASVFAAARPAGSKPVYPSMISDEHRARSVCVVGLPASVDGSRSIAVLADGVLGIRMVKVQPRP